MAYVSYPIATATLLWRERTGAKASVTRIVYRTARSLAAQWHHFRALAAPQRRSNALRHGRGRLLDGIARKVRVPGRCLRLRVAEHPADDRQPIPLAAATLANECRKS